MKNGNGTMSTNSAGFRHWERNGKAIVALPTNLVLHGAGRVDISRLTNDPRELASVIEYRLCEMMGQAGFAYNAIADTLGLTKSEVGHRLKKMSVKVKDYRDGKSPLARQVIKRLDEVAQRRMYQNLQKYLLK